MMKRHLMEELPFIATENIPFSLSTTVRLTPFIEMLPLGTVIEGAFFASYSK